MRIVSLLPSATEIVCALGLREELVGVSHRCDYPPEIEGVAVVTRPHAASDIPRQLGDEIGACELDVETLLTCRPELVLAREGGQGPSGKQIREALGRIGADATIVSLDPCSVEGIFNTISTIGAMTEAEDDAIDLLEALREEIGAIEQQVVVTRDGGAPAPRVVVLQRFEPPLASGLWVPEQVRRAGGWDLLGREGEPAAATTWEEIREIDPEMLILAPAGMHLAEAKRAWARLEKPELWAELGAVRRGRVFMVEPVYFDRPGPRVVDGVALLAEILDPDTFVETSPPASWTPLSQ
jgi:iron complex transport system substrate-binding protein